MQELALDESLFQAYMDRVTTKKGIQGAVLHTESACGSFSSLHSTGYMKHDDQYFIASVTKLFITTILLKLRMENRLQLEDRISSYLTEDEVCGIHELDGVDYSHEITIKHLMSNTSGIPNYAGGSVFSDLVKGNDQSWTLEKTLTAVKEMKPKFKPGQKGKAQYCDTNYKLLGNIIETVTGMDIHTVFHQFIFEPLNLEKTYVYGDQVDSHPHPPYHKRKKLHLPMYFVSIPSEGGIVSTAKETTIFLKAFFNGHFFPKDVFKELEKWHLLLGPGTFFYGIGISRQPLTLMGINKGLIGHWGQSGAFGFYHPETDLYFSGTINEATGHAAAVKLIVKMIKLYKTERRIKA